MEIYRGSVGAGCQANVFKEEDIPAATTSPWAWRDMRLGACISVGAEAIFGHLVHDKSRLRMAADTTLKISCRCSINGI